eukprot:13637740-Heterocapsa_arctica.AAC.1
MPMVARAPRRPAPGDDVALRQAGRGEAVLEEHVDEAFLEEHADERPHAEEASTLKTTSPGDRRAAVRLSWKNMPKRPSWKS